MEDIKNTTAQNKFWSARYTEARTGWDIGYPSTPLKEYIDQLENKQLRILIPGAGNAYEAEYLFKNGFEQVFVLDIATAPLKALQERVPSFPSDHLLLGNFFEHTGQYDLILEQTFFCSFPPTTTNRQLYAQKMNELMSPNGKLVGLWFDIPLTGDMVKRPFGGTKEAYENYLAPYFDILTFEKCTNSIAPRMGTELFGIFQKNNSNSSTKSYRNNGAIGALLDEYEKAVGELKDVISTVSQEELITIVDQATKDEDCRSIQTILSHVVGAGFNYVIYIRNWLGEDLAPKTKELLPAIPDYATALDNMFAYKADLFADYPDLSLEEFESDKKIKVRWGQQYDVEQLLEHSIVHILRHRRQIERFKIRLKAIPRNN